MATPSPVLVIGAGLAGLSCAAALARAGLAVTLLEKGRRPGGRVATRRVEDAAFNHGARFATDQGGEFGALLHALREKGQAAPWPGPGGEAGRLCFLPGMSALPAALAAEATAHGASLLAGRHAAFLHREAAGWRVRHLPAAEAAPGSTSGTGGELSAPQAAVVLAMPAPQAAALLRTAGHGFAARAAEAVMAPCWTLLACFAAPLACPDEAHDPTGAIAWAGRENARPGRAATPECWTIQAGAAWSRARLEDGPAEAARRLLAEFQRLTGAPAPQMAQAHRWRHALVEVPLGTPCLWDDQAGLGACGDWCLGDGLEAAHASGLALARAVLARPPVGAAAVLA